MRLPGEYPAAAFPFSAVAATDLAKQALLLLAVDPGLKGVLISGGPGTAKSLLARSFRLLLADRRRGQEPPFVEVPLGVTEDRLLGGLNLERTLLTGRRQMTGGLLAKAHGGVLYVDEINLLDRSLTHHIATALDAGMIRFEREGLGAEFLSDFAFIGTYDPVEREVSAPLIDSVGLHVSEAGGLASQERVEMLHRVAAFDRDPPAFAGQYAAETALLQERIAEARGRLPEVDLRPDDQRRLSQAALGLGVEGHRADIFAVRLTRARAALMGRTRVEEEDLEAAVRLVLWPRARVPGPRRAPVQSEGGESSHEPAQSQADESRPAPGAATPEGETVPRQQMEDLIAGALPGDLPEEVLSLASVDARKQDSRHASRRTKNPVETTSWNRGRFVRAVARKPEGGKIALGATLRAAAPSQVLRRRSAWADSNKPAIQVAAGDLRFKQFKQKAGILIVFAVDASGSMAHNRISQAKGAVLGLLRQAYLNRDRVALLSFRGDRAEVLLPPSRSVERAKRALEAIPVGGGTPLAAGLRGALDLARRARHSDVRQALLVLFTDGRANVAWESGRTGGRDGIWRELEEVCAALRFERVASVVVDTRRRVLSKGDVERLVKLLGGGYVRLSRPDAAAVCDTVATVAETLRGPA
jgi:magnesium chelatase subunit D